MRGIPWIDCEKTGHVLGTACRKGGGGGGTTTTTTQQNADPWSGQQPYLTKGFKQAETILDSAKPEFFPGSTVVPQSQETLMAQGMRAGQALDPDSLVNRASGQVGNTVSGGYLDSPEGFAARTANPMLNEGPNAYIGNVADSVFRTVNPAVSSRFARSGRNANSPVAQQMVAKGMADAMAPYMFGSAEADQSRRFQAGESALTRGAGLYDAERNRQMEATTMAPQMADVNPTLLASVGASKEGVARDQLQEDIDRFNFEQNKDRAKITDYMSLITGNYGGSSQSTATQPYFSNPLMTGIGAAAGLTSIGQGLFGKPGVGGNAPGGLFK